MQFIQVMLALLSIALPVMLIVGLISPRLVLPKLKNKTRKNAALIYAGLLIATLVLIGLVADDDKKSSATPAIESNPVPVIKDETPRPAPEPILKERVTGTHFFENVIKGNIDINKPYDKLICPDYKFRVVDIGSDDFIIVETLTKDLYRGENGTMKFAIPRQGKNFIANQMIYNKDVCYKFNGFTLHYSTVLGATNALLVLFPVQQESEETIKARQEADKIFLGNK